jgi:Holliday junction resolvase RusA-like endonuclease
MHETNRMDTPNTSTEKPFLIEFFVAGKPQTAGSKRAFVIKKGGVYTGRAIVTDDNPKARDWKSDIRNEAQKAWSGPLLTGAIRLRLAFQVSRPQGHFRTGKCSGMVKDSAPMLPTTKPDATKLLRAVEDALTGVIWKDDSQITTQVITKRYDFKPGVRIEIENDRI